MIQNVLRELGGVGIYGVISVCLFFTVFSVALIRALLLSKKVVAEMRTLPLDEKNVNPGDDRHE